ncbi:hypothetical protein K2W90_04545 [Candidatus Babeliales bacterium]|nr:hypothetical protein [Candidatus Babeliales bacterium]
MKKIFFCALTASWLFASVHASVDEKIATLQTLNFNEKIATLTQLIQTTGQRTLSKEDQETCASFLMGLFHEVALHGEPERIAFKNLLHSLLASTLLTHEQREYITKLMLPFVDPASQAATPTIQRSPATEPENAHANNRVFHDTQQITVPIITKEWVPGESGKLEQKTEISFKTVKPHTTSNTQQKHVTEKERQLTRSVTEETTSKGSGRRPRCRKAGIYRSA